MTRLNQRRIVDAALVCGLIAAWVTHESGALLHSLVSVGFTAALALHARNNWQRYTATLRRTRKAGVLDLVITALMVVVVVTGFIYWATSGDTTLFHEALAIGATVGLLGHFWVRRKSLARLLRPISRDMSSVS